MSTMIVSGEIEELDYTYLLKNVKGSDGERDHLYIPKRLFNRRIRSGSRVVIEGIRSSSQWHNHTSFRSIKSVEYLR